MIKKSIIISLLIVPFMMSGCKKENNDPLPVIGATPSLEISSLSPNSIKQFDDIEFTIFYQDGDGDLGDESADIKSLIITDNRFPLDHEYHIPPLGPTGDPLVIQGNFNITLKGVILKDQNNSAETATFTVKVKDRAGNWSTPVTSASVTINK